MFARPALFAWAFVLFAALASAVGQSPYPVTGVPTTSKAMPLRKNINDLYAAKGPQWDIYIWALQEMRKQNINDEGSFFQVAGIHGEPFIQWNGAGPSHSNGWLGYCPHGENLFLPWHRPYVMLYEMRLVAYAKTLAQRYPKSVRAKYVSAANNLRSPYWDWAATGAVPPCTAPSTLKITVPTNDGKKLKTVSVQNPLRYYTFPKAATGGEFGSFDSGARIEKCPSPQSYPASANKLMSQRPYKQWTYDALTLSQTFDQFASTGSNGVSLEMIHNAIHWDGSCAQQFLDASFSAYDPLFMLHHTNVDRLWAYWQAMKPSEAIFKKSYQGGARWGNRDGATISPNTPLQPFFSKPGTFYTSNSVSSIKGKGYSYEGLEYWSKSAAQMKKDATSIVNRLYASGVTKPRLARRDGEAPTNVTRYFAEIELDVTQVERPCSVNVYVDNVSVGSLIVMMQPATGTTFGKFALDDAKNPLDLVEAKTSTVVSDILKTIRVDIVKPDGTVIDVKTVPSLQIRLQNIDLSIPDSDEQLPTYSGSDTRTAPKKQIADPGQHIA